VSLVCTTPRSGLLYGQVGDTTEKIDTMIAGLIIASDLNFWTSGHLQDSRALAYLNKAVDLNHFHYNMFYHE